MGNHLRKSIMLVVVGAAVVGTVVACTTSATPTNEPPATTKPIDGPPATKGQRCHPKDATFKADSPACAAGLVCCGNDETTQFECFVPGTANDPSGEPGCERPRPGTDAGTDAPPDAGPTNPFAIFAGDLTVSGNCDDSDNKVKLIVVDGLVFDISGFGTNGAVRFNVKTPTTAQATGVVQFGKPDHKLDATIAGNTLKLHAEAASGSCDATATK